MEKAWITGKWKKWKKDQLLIVLLIGILLLIIALPHGEDTAQEEAVMITQEQPEVEDTARRMEMRLQEVLQQVQGVGRVQVMITLKSYGKKTVEKDRSVSDEKSGSGDNESQTRRTEETAIYTRDSQGNEIPFVAEETAPQVEGVLVAAQGGDNLSVVESISEAAMVLFGVEAHKIKVMKLN